MTVTLMMVNTGMMVIMMKVKMKELSVWGSS